MNFHTNQSKEPLHIYLKGVLSNLRERRNFNAEDYIFAKATKLNRYMTQHKLKSCVIAVSGGIDSAVVLGLVSRAAQLAESPIKKIVPVTIPVFKNEYTTHQEEATARALEVIEAVKPKEIKYQPITVDLTSSFQTLKETIDTSLATKGEPWAAGQLVSYLRTPTYYYITSLLSQEGLPAIVCGTTNRDEGAYLGYFGKASDGMVDVQLISDLHKSEVFKVGQQLNIPKSILEAIPTGDMFDGRSDEEVFGTNYDFVELFLQLKTLSLREKDYYTRWIGEAKEQLGVLSQKLEQLHEYNKHKYLGKSPAVHLDLLESGVPGGWPENKPAEEKIDHSKIVNEFNLNEIDYYVNYSTKLEKINELNGHAYKLHNLLRQEEIKELLEQIPRWVPAATNGYAKAYKPGDQVGSYRASAFSETWSELIWLRIAPLITKLVDHNGQVWRSVGVSSLLRFIKYQNGGFLYPHYDAPFEYANGNKTLASLIIYLQNTADGGKTRFIKDPQVNSTGKWSYNDWDRQPKKEEILYSVTSKSGSGLIFDHLTLHDGELVTGEGSKIIIRTDIVYQPC